MSYINTTDSTYPHSEADIRRAFPNTSFANPFTPPDAYKVVFPAPQPTVSIIQSVRETAPILTGKGHYEQAWEIVPRFVEYTDEQGVTHTVQEQETAAIMADAVAKTQAFIASVTVATQARLDDFAKTRNYDGILSACTYASSPSPKFSGEGQYCVNVRDSTWATLYALMAQVQGGQRSMPATVADVLAELPVLEWP
jgi:hypothetical protein